jgi:hypothetical protein
VRDLPRFWIAMQIWLVICSIAAIVIGIIRLS